MSEKVVIGIGGRAQTYHLMAEGEHLCRAPMIDQHIVDKEHAVKYGRLLCTRCRWLDGASGDRRVAHG